MMQKLEASFRRSTFLRGNDEDHDDIFRDMSRRMALTTTSSAHTAEAAGAACVGSIKDMKQAVETSNSSKRKREDATEEGGSGAALIEPKEEGEPQSKSKKATWFDRDAAVTKALNINKKWKR